MNLHRVIPSAELRCFQRTGAFLVYVIRHKSGAWLKRVYPYIGMSHGSPEGPVPNNPLAFRL